MSVASFALDVLRDAVVAASSWFSSVMRSAGLSGFVLVMFFVYTCVRMFIIPIVGEAQSDVASQSYGAIRRWQHNQRLRLRGNNNTQRRIGDGR